MQQAEEVLRLYREVYFDLNIRHFHEKLQEEHGIKLSYTWVPEGAVGIRTCSSRAGEKQQGRRRERRPLPGMLLHIVAMIAGTTWS